MCCRDESYYEIEKEVAQLYRQQDCISDQIILVYILINIYNCLDTSRNNKHQVVAVISKAQDYRDFVHLSYTFL